jgi:hypothetical protein
MFGVDRIMKLYIIYIYNMFSPYKNNDKYFPWRIYQWFAYLLAESSRVDHLFRYFCAKYTALCIYICTLKKENILCLRVNFLYVLYKQNNEDSMMWICKLKPCYIQIISKSQKNASVSKYVGIIFNLRSFFRVVTYIFESETLLEMTSWQKYMFLTTVTVSPFN